ncbi:prepilin peptidase [bacterium]|nr:MAG: prepilin peptidase [bacterium]
MNGEWSGFLIFLVGIYGLLVGSFLNAWVWRVHTHRKVSKGRSMCPHCKTTLHWYELLPVLSWLGLKGKCRTCHKLISWQYPAVELANAGLWVALLLFFAPASPLAWLQLGLWCVLASLLLAALVYDTRWMLLPDAFVMPATAVALVLAGLSAMQAGSLAELWPKLLAATIFAGVFFLIWLVSGGSWIGDGDIWLAGIMGLVLSGTQLVVAIFVAFNLGAIVGLALIVIHKKTRKSMIAFGPFLIIGLFAGLFFGEALLNWYMGIFV